MEPACQNDDCLDNDDDFEVDENVAANGALSENKERKCNATNHIPHFSPIDQELSPSVATNAKRFHPVPSDVIHINLNNVVRGRREFR